MSVMIGISLLEITFAAIVVLFVLPRGVIIPKSSDLTSPIESIFLPAVLHSPSAAAAIAQFNKSLSSTGFVIIHLDHLPPSIYSPSSLAKLRTAALDFFTMEEEVKMGYNYGPYGNPKGGFTPVGVEDVGSTIGSDTEKDWVENYVFRTHPSLDYANHPTSLASTGVEYFTQMENVLRILHKMSSLSFGLDEDYFNDNFFPGPNGNSLRLAHYPSQSSPSGTSTLTPGSIRYGAHTDYQTFTILSPDPNDSKPGYGGLEVKVGDEWVKVESNGGFVVNAGDLWEDWTGRRWKSGLHRVVNPTSEEGMRSSRLSVPFFTGPRPDTMVKDVLGANGDGEGIMAGEHLRRKLERSNE
mmetsp:Transcript_4162/g.8362  ORF Transcript_4162/g.8362 Transcript_4162/m.8362 type:complete len:354 (+) Transcript_4162:1-1062(+)